MSDYINRKAVIRFIRDKVSLSLFMKRSVDKANKACMELCDMLNRDLPSADVEPVKHGWWIVNKCSVCGFLATEWIERCHYCPSCGARMTVNKMSELDKLEEYLKVRDYDYERYDTEKCLDSRGRIVSLDRHQIIVTRDDGNRAWDAICQSGSYGYEEGLLEIYGDIVWDDIDGDSVRGELTAQDVINRIEHGRDGARMEGEQDG